ncbi:DUF222 domain-containing protein [Actinomyces sp.]|uniref:HNH endonuclease signature motif containing protein n=1 Tax=Actinomyces sp. TaxID=29317 RepID=UPI00289C8FB7|nr:DUF222 domain-containing protein [Actinomyces sp.]
METRRTDTHSPILPLGERVALARRTLVELSDAERLAGLADQELIDALGELEDLGRLVDAGRAFAAAEVHQRSRTELGNERLCVKKGFTRAVDLVADTTGTSTGAAHRRITQVQSLQPAISLSGREEPSHFPLTRACVGAGLVSPEASLVVTEALQEALDRGATPVRVGEGERALLAAVLGADRVRRHMDIFGSQAGALLAEARDTTPGRGRTLAQVRRLASAWRLMLTQEGDRARGEDAQRRRATERERVHNSRHLRLLPTRGGTRRVEGELLPEVAAQLERVLDAYMNPRVDGTRHGEGDPGVGGTATGVADSGDALPGTGASDGGRLGGSEVDRRTRGQRLHDAFGGVLTVAAGVPDMPLLGGAPPTLVVTIDQDQLDDPLGAGFLSGTHDEADSAVDASTAHHAGCSGQVQTLVTSRSGGIRELSSPSRIFTAHQRRAIAVRDGGCCIPGCEVPATWCEVHHVHEHARGGPTHTDNGATLCWHHHRQLHALGWDIQMRDGTPWVRPPAGIDPTRAWRPAQTGTSGHFRQLIGKRDAASSEPSASSASDLGRPEPGPPDRTARGVGPPGSTSRSLEPPGEAVHGAGPPGEAVHGAGPPDSPACNAAGTMTGMLPGLQEEALLRATG